MHALVISLVLKLNGAGISCLMGDETTDDKGFNMQQIPKHEQELFLKLTSTIGQAYSLHTPQSTSTALRRGSNMVNHPYQDGPFYLLMLMNVQPKTLLHFNLHEIPSIITPIIGAAADGF